ncbi:MAG: 50S ribosomal protein L24 [Deltaproteobacteria bacterium HGW-Deltaproteobacteria-9]|nr:MAG: 50S ribosomal protein L24 [Deltaproteobacteria bacterium HGW-Deltaproteobacteria-9]
MQKIKLKKGDAVKVLTGKDAGKTGKILKVIGKENKIVVEKLNLIKKHQRPDARGKGGIVEKEAPLETSNVMFVCNKCNVGVRIGYKILDDGKKVRICKKCGEILDA